MGFDNAEGLFPAVKSSTRFCLLTLAKGWKATAIRFSFLLRSVKQVADPDTQFTLTAEELAYLNPNTKTSPVFRTSRDCVLGKSIYRRVPVLLDEHAGARGNPWGIQFTQGLFNTTSDSACFRTAGALEAQGSRITGNVYRHKDGRHLPLFEAKMAGPLGHRAMTFAHGAFHDSADDDLRDASYVALPQYWVEEKRVRSEIPTAWSSAWLAGWQDITDVNTMARSVKAAIVPLQGVADTFLLHYVSGVPAAGILSLQALLNTFMLDYVARQKIGGVHLKYPVFKQLAVLAPTVLAAPTPWDSALSTGDWTSRRALELCCTAWDLQPLAQDCGCPGPPFRWDEERRFVLRSELDAAFFHLYMACAQDGGWLTAENETAADVESLKQNFPTPRDAVAYIMDTFSIVRRKDEEKHGEYRTKRVILEIYDAMLEAIRTGRPYQMRVDPPPADSGCRHPKKVIGILAFGSLINDPGPELEAMTVLHIRTRTPFPVEYGRYSGKTRGGAPTLVPHSAGGPVEAEILVLDDVVSPSDAADMLWRRETRKVGSGDGYTEGASDNSVLVRHITDSPCVSDVLYTDFHPGGKIERLSAEELAKRAIQSVKTAADGQDGISYLMANVASGIKTPLTPAYEAEILLQTNTQSLEEALRTLKPGAA